MALAARRKRGRPTALRGVSSRELIVHSARTVFTDVGYSATTLQEIAARIDVARTLVTHHFATKADLYHEAIGQPALALIEAARSSAQHAATLPDQLTSFISGVLDFNSTAGSGFASADLLITAARESLRHPGLTGKADTLGALRTFVSTAVHNAADHGKFDTDTDLSATIDVLSSILWGVTIYASCTGASANLMAIVDGLERLTGNRLWTLKAADW